jgi:hypothetical protein
MTKLFVCLAAFSLASQAQKNYKDSGEYDLFQTVVQDVDSGAFAKALTDLDAWQAKYPESEFKDERQFFEVLAYTGSGRMSEALDAGAELLGSAKARLDAAKQVRLLYTITTALPQIPQPTPKQLAAGEKAARDLASFDKVPEGVPPDTWASTRAQLQAAARGTLLYAALYPAAQALRQGDCAAAESAVGKALEQYPESAQAAGYLGEAERCLYKTGLYKTGLYKTDPTGATLAIYEFARAASLDPVKGMVDPKWQQQTVEPALERLYNAYHGADPEGLRKLKELAVRTPLPPEGFTIESAAQITDRKQAAFEASYPELALWMRIKAELAGPDGVRYFKSELEGVEIPELKGVLVDAKPACRPSELLLAIPPPDAKPPFKAEIGIKLEKPLTGKPELNTEVRMEGSADAFSPMPFLLSIKTQSEKLQGLTILPCQQPRAAIKKN